MVVVAKLSRKPDRLDPADPGGKIGEKNGARTAWEFVKFSTSPAVMYDTSVSVVTSSKHIR